MHTDIYSPAALLFIHIENERLFGETELVFPLSSIVIQSFDCALKHNSKRPHSAFITVYFYIQPLGGAISQKCSFLFPPLTYCYFFFLSFVSFYTLIKLEVNCTHSVTYSCCGHLIGLHIEMRSANLIQCPVVKLLRNKQFIFKSVVARVAF